jgi:WD40 repeat protein
MSAANGNAESLRYRAFISYSRADRAAAKDLQAKLERYVLPRALRWIKPGLRHDPRPLRPVFRDEDELVPGQDLPERIRAGLAGSEYLLVICSPAAARSVWVNREILDFARLGRSQNILAIVVAGQPHAASPDSECLPPALRFQLERRADGLLDVSDVPAEPLWVDWREATRSDRTVFLRVVAALLSLASLDELVRRDARRRQNRARQLVAAASAAVVALLSILVVAVGAIQQEKANDSQTLADLARSAADNDDYEVAARYSLAGLSVHQPVFLNYDDAPSEEILARVVESSPVRRALTKHTDAVYAVALSLDGKTAVSGSADKTARLWDTQSGREIGDALQHNGVVYSVAFSPDGTRVATASWDGHARVWNVADQREIAVMAEANGVPAGDGVHNVNSVAFNPRNGNLLATASQDGYVRLWNATTGHPYGRPMRQWGPAGAERPQHAYAVAFSPDGQFIVSAGNDASLNKWRVADQSLVRTFAVERADVISVAFSPDGKTLAAALGNSVVELWDPNGGKRPELRTDAGFIAGLAFSKDSRTLATGSTDHTARLWDLASHRQVAIFRGSEDSVWSVALAPDGTTLMTGSLDGVVRFWDVLSGRKIGVLAHSGFVNAVAFSAHDGSVATGSDDHFADVWDSASGRLTAAIRASTGSVDAVALDPIGRRWLATGSSDGRAVIWDIASSAPVTGETLALGGDVTAVAFSPDGRYLAAASNKGILLAWDIQRRTARWPPIAGLGGLASVAFSPHGDLIATGSDDHTARVFRAASGDQIQAFPVSVASVNSVAFSPDGRWLAAGVGRQAMTQNGLTKGATLVWDTKGGRRLAELPQQDAVKSLAFFPDSNRLATGSNDGTARIWDIANSRQIDVITDHRREVTSVAVASDGGTIITGSKDSTARLRQISVARERGEALARLACARLLPGTLSRYLPDELRTAPMIDRRLSQRGTCAGG